jgi:hypothetical protein
MEAVEGTALELLNNLKGEKDNIARENIVRRLAICKDQLMEACLVAYDILQDIEVALLFGSKMYPVKGKLQHADREHTV